MQTRQKLARTGVHGPPVQEGPLRQLGAQEHVLGDGELGNEVELLVDRDDAGIACLAGRARRVGPALVDDLAAVGHVDAGQDLHERGLAGTVLADQRVDLAGQDVHAHVGEGMDAREALLDGAHLQDGRAGQGARRSSGGAVATISPHPS